MSDLLVECFEDFQKKDAAYEFGHIAVLAVVYWKKEMELLLKEYKVTLGLL